MMRRQASISMCVAAGTPRLARSSSGVWWKLAGDSSEVEVEAERRLRGIADEEAAVRARMERRRHEGAPAVRRGIALTSVSLEAVAVVYGLWRALRRDHRRGNNSNGGSRAMAAALMMINKQLLLPALAVPAVAAIALAAFARFQNMLDRRDQQQLDRLRAERKAKIGNFRGSHHNLHKLIQKYDADDDDAIAADSKKLKRTHSRLSFFHVGDGTNE
ncbi:hypothetical protein U9M48_021399 [Paspalum notatum var. saurae]|uniref:Uncharacterized protein n=1 Tax=Paspalum notatum var. saurae TaxID=547442 RepID=A0AAQ3TJJ0_PASNO